MLERLKVEQPDHFYLLTFFSPSGYLQHSNYSKANSVHYLPLDNKPNAKQFIEIVKPKIVVFVKYEFWLFYFKELSGRQIPLFLISAKLTESHLFFQWYGSRYRQVLKLPTLFFVQDEKTNELLKGLDIDNTMVTGDTRIDRVLEVLSSGKDNAIVESFLDNRKAVVVGSSWKTEEDYVMKWLNSGAFSGKIIMAPHEINPQKITEFMEKLSVSSVRYSQVELGLEEPKGQVLILDCIGVLKEIYKYGSWAFIGGGFSDGIHNILEPATFGLPILFGPNYKKFGEAEDLIEQGGAVSIKSYKEFFEQSALLMNPMQLKERSQICESYIHQNQGATEMVVKHLKSYL